MQITVLGAGAWGTAVAAQAALRHPTLLWGRDPAQMAEIAATRRNQRYLPDADLPARLVCSGDWDAALAHVSQGAGGPLTRGPLSKVLSLLGRTDTFMRAYPPATPDVREDDLFAGVTW